jgi:hypothetical protein
MSETSERMSRVDTAWLRMDSRVNLMMIVGIWLLRPALGYAALRERLESRLLAYARFRQKVVHEAVFSYWVATSSATSSSASAGRASVPRCRRVPASSPPRRSIRPIHCGRSA